PARSEDSRAPRRDSDDVGRRRAHRRSGSRRARLLRRRRLQRRRALGVAGDRRAACGVDRRRGASDRPDTPLDHAIRRAISGGTARAERGVAVPSLLWSRVTRHIALLRGVNLGRNRRLVMAELRDVVDALGYKDVRTHLQSGNIVLTSGKKPATVKQELERAIADE